MSNIPTGYPDPADDEIIAYPNLYEAKNDLTMVIAMIEENADADEIYTELDYITQKLNGLININNQQNNE